MRAAVTAPELRKPDVIQAVTVCAAELLLRCCVTSLLPSLLKALVPHLSSASLAAGFHSDATVKAL